ncbi:MAG: hypothetical protein GTO14_00825, partial [Anaerolineales bacterium]|nr:hypothetical protein [Anaerolineales bacterium]
MIEFSSGNIRLGFSRITGELYRLGFSGGESMVGYGADGCALDVRLGRDRWLSQDHSPVVVGHGQNDTSIHLRLQFGPVHVRDEYHIEGDRIDRRVAIQNNSEGEIQLTRVHLHLRGVQIGDPEDCNFEAPASAIRPRLPLNVAMRQSIGGPYSKTFAPGAAERFGWAIEDAPDVTPGLLAIHNPEKLESLLVWYYSEVEAGSPLVFGDGTSLILGHEIHLAGWMSPGEEIEGGTQIILLHRGEWNEALEGFREAYHVLGVEPPIYGVPPDWVREAAVYEVHPGPFGGFRGLASQLPRIREMGHTVLYLMPVMTFDNRSGVAWDENWIGSGSPYAMKDFEAFEPTLGSEKDFTALIKEAHNQGMKVLMDFVTQGCAIDARYVHEHPEWFSRDEGGNLVSSHGWLDTYSFDWANPEFQAYMLDWALRFVRTYGI